VQRNQKQNRENGLSFSTIQAAIDGDTNAINRIVDHYGGYISKLSTRLLFDQYGNIYRYVDEDMRRQLQTKLITKILNFKLC